MLYRSGPVLHTRWRAEPAWRRDGNSCGCVGEGDVAVVMEAIATATPDAEAVGRSTASIAQRLPVMGLPARDGPGLGLSGAAQTNRCC